MEMSYPPLPNFVNILPPLLRKGSLPHTSSSFFGYATASRSVSMWIPEVNAVEQEVDCYQILRCTHFFTQLCWTVDIAPQAVGRVWGVRHSAKRQSKFDHAIVPLAATAQRRHYNPGLCILRAARATWHHRSCTFYCWCHITQTVGSSMQSPRGGTSLHIVWHKPAWWR